MAFGINAGAVRAGINTSYSVTVDATSPDVSDILILETYPPYAYASTYSFYATSGATSVFVNPFNLDGLPAESFLMGIVNGLASDGDSPVDHLVLFLNPTVATTILDNNLSFSSLFPATSESDLITTFETVVRTPSGSPEWNDAYTALTKFIFSAQSMTITTADGTSTADGFIPGPTDSTPGEGTLIAFSDPQQIGSVTSTLVGSNAVPEPSSLTLGAIGALGCLICFRRRRI
jgi:PEP-CTERM motif